MLFDDIYSHIYIITSNGYGDIINENTMFEIPQSLDYSFTIENKIILNTLIDTSVDKYETIIFKNCIIGEDAFKRLQRYNVPIKYVCSKITTL